MRAARLQELKNWYIGILAVAWPSPCSKVREEGEVPILQRFAEADSGLIDISHTEEMVWRCGEVKVFEKAAESIEFETTAPGERACRVPPYNSRSTGKVRHSLQNLQS